MGYPSVVGTPTTAGSSTAVGSIAVSRPAGAQNGDWLVAALRSQSNVSSADFTSSGWTRLTVPFVASQDNGRVMGLYYRPVTNIGTEPSTYTFTHTGMNSRVAAAIFIVRPTSGWTLHVGEYSSPYVGVAATNGRTAAAYSVTHDSLVLAFWAGEFSASVSETPNTLPSGYSATVSPFSGGLLSQSRTAGWVGQRNQTTGSVGAATLTWASAPSGAGAMSVSIWEEDTNVGPGPTLVTSLWTGSAEVTAAAYLWDGSAEQNVSQLLAIPKPDQHYSISQMENDISLNKDVTWAHRGGSANWSEMTMRAYTNAVWWGAKALEISVCVSADGVFIMSHDTTLDRVTGTNLGAISTLNASQMLGLPVIEPQGGGVVGRLEDVLDSYSDLLLIIDNKTGAQYQAFMTLIKQHVPDWQNQVILKIDGASSASRFAEAQTAGFKTAAYFYDSTSAQKIIDNMPYTDYPGLNNSAAQSYWNTLLAYNKPIWGHVLQTTSNYTEAKTKGAKIFQCANVKTLIPMINNVT